jgi:hypothetical protein
MATPSKKPPYNTARGTAELNQSPPFLFQDVTALVFPLRADRYALSKLVEQYLDIIPTAIAEFRPAAPVVYLAVLHYGQMRSIGQGPGQGWVSQNEVTFLVPLEWYERRGGETVFVDWAWVSPYIFVDDELSLIGGRDFYGWPKVLSQISYLGLQDLNPRHRSRVLTVYTTGFPLRRIGEKDRPELLLEIDRDPLPSFSVFPPDLLNPYTILPDAPQMTLDILSAIRDGLECLLRSPVIGDRRRFAPRTLREMLNAGITTSSPLAAAFCLSQMASQLSSGARGPDSTVVSFNHITFKQFHDAEDPLKYACYQAAITSPLGIRRYRRGGLLGDLNLLRGDPTGGYQLYLFREPLGKLILEKLGLEVADERRVDGKVVATLCPLPSFWAEADLYYGLPDTLGWRFWEPYQERHWYRGSTKQYPVPDERPKDRPASQYGHHPYRGEERESPQPSPPLPYNYATGEDLDFPKNPGSRLTLLEIYPLKAEEEKLKKFCKQYIEDLHPSLPERPQKPLPKYWFKPLGSYVYVIVINYQEEDKPTGANLPDEVWSPREVAFSIPVVWGKDLPQEQPLNIALLAPFVFVETENDAIIDREISGRPTMDATLEVHSAKQPPTPTPNVRYPLLTLKTEVIPKQGPEQRVIERPLMEIYQGDVLPQVAGDPTLWYEVAKEWGQNVLKKDHEEKKRIKSMRAADGSNFARAVNALRDILKPEGLKHNSMSVNSLMLKQFRDVNDLDAACYQAIVFSGWVIEGILDIKEFEELQHIALYQYASPPIFGTLGLIEKVREKLGGVEVVHLQPIRPFQMQVRLKEAPRTQNVCWRAGDLVWQGVQFGIDFLDGKRRSESADPDPVLKEVYDVKELHALVEALLSIGYELRSKNPSPRALQERAHKLNWKADFFVRSDSAGPDGGPLPNNQKVFSEKQVIADLWYTTELSQGEIEEINKQLKP